MTETMQKICPDDLLAAVLALAEDNESAALARIDALAQDHPDDPRLHFLGGSLLASQERYAEARTAMARSIAIAPDYAIARFQLGLLELSSGDAAAAEATLQPLADAEPGDALALFARGLRHLARDELAKAAELLREGMAQNEEHPLVSRDMALIVAKIEEGEAGADAPPEQTSAAHMLLQQDAAKSTKH